MKKENWESKKAIGIWKKATRRIGETSMRMIDNKYNRSKTMTLEGCGADFEETYEVKEEQRHENRRNNRYI